jgi:hypothetical protein
MPTYAKRYLQMMTIHKLNEETYLQNINTARKRRGSVDTTANKSRQEFMPCGILRILELSGGRLALAPPPVCL